jgi:hypothetical protein
MAGSALVEIIIATTGICDGFRWRSTQVSDTSETWVLVQPLMRKVDDDYSVPWILLQEKARGGGLAIINYIVTALIMCLASQDPNGV